MIDNLDLAFGGNLIALGNRRQTVGGKVQGDDPIVRPQLSNPGLPGVQIGRKPVDHDDGRATGLALIAIVDPNPVGQGHESGGGSGVFSLQIRIGQVLGAASQGQGDC